MKDEAMEDFSVVRSQRTVPKMHLPTIDRSIREENSTALLRRWRLATTEVIADPRVIARWFPAQRELFSILSVLTELQVIELADCGVPLFTVRLPSVANDGVFHSSMPANAFEAECIGEGFMSLISRLDALRTSYTQASCLFDLNTSQANFISRHSPRELQAIAGDPAVVLIPAASDEFFTVSAMTSMTSRERTVLAATTRRVRGFSN